jgi:hypothetical protein
MERALNGAEQCVVDELGALNVAAASITSCASPRAFCTDEREDPAQHNTFFRDREHLKSHTSQERR